MLESAYGAAIVQRSFAEVSSSSKREALVRLLAPDVLRVARSLAEPLGREPESLAPELVDAAVALPVYRTYVRPGDVTVSDRALLAEAVPDEELRAALLLELPGATDGALRFQQLTSPAMAKGVEDTALYRHHALAARNEVGAHPGEAPGGAAALQAALAARCVAWPSALAALGTHDSKRGPDVRARLLVLAELGDEWVEAVGHFEVLERDIRPDGAVEVDANAALAPVADARRRLAARRCRAAGVRRVACGTTRSRRRARRRSARPGRSPTRPTRTRSPTW